VGCDGLEVMTYYGFRAAPDTRTVAVMLIERMVGVVPHKWRVGNPPQDGILPYKQMLL
jgi:hypothetical protein